MLQQSHRTGLFNTAKFVQLVCLWWPSFKGKEALKIWKGGLSHLCGLKYSKTIPDWQLYEYGNPELSTIRGLVSCCNSTYAGSALMVVYSWANQPGLPSQPQWCLWCSSPLWPVLCVWLDESHQNICRLLAESPLTIHRGDTTWGRHLCQTHWLLGQVSSTQQVGFDLHKDSLKIPFDLAVPDSFWL